VEVELFPTAYRIEAGHRIRVQVSEGAFPRFARNFGTGQPFAAATVVASATATRDLPVPGGPPVPASTLQAATLAGIADLFAVVAGTPDDLPG